MKTLMRTRISLVAATMFVAGVLAAPAVAGDKKQVPFNGSVQGQEVDVFQGPPPGTLLVYGNGNGIATHLGRFTLAWDVTVNLATGSGVGSCLLIAA